MIWLLPLAALVSGAGYLGLCRVSPDRKCRPCKATGVTRPSPNEPKGAKFPRKPSGNLRPTKTTTTNFGHRDWRGRRHGIDDEERPPCKECRGDGYVRRKGTLVVMLLSRSFREEMTGGASAA